MPEARWQTVRDAFFRRAGLPSQADEVPAYLTARLGRAYDHFLDRLPEAVLLPSRISLLGGNPLKGLVFLPKPPTRVVTRRRTSPVFSGLTLVLSS